MPPPWAETPTKVVLEFLKSNQGSKRVITMKHNGQALPPQLAGRVTPQAWAAFMQEVYYLADHHPYVIKPSAGRVAGWAGSFLMASIIGFFFMSSPDGGDYDQWLGEVNQLIARHQPAFGSAGCHLSLQRAQQSYWIQIDVDPSMAVGQPVMMPAGKLP